jgi:predicted glycosyltransferase
VQIDCRSTGEGCERSEIHRRSVDGGIDRRQRRLRSIGDGGRKYRREEETRDCEKYIKRYYNLLKVKNKKKIIKYYYN